MFDFFRKHNKIVMIFLFLLIIPSFVLFGVERYQGSGKDEKVAASMATTSRGPSGTRSTATRRTASASNRPTSIRRCSIPT
jgi:hypothetical protein